LRQHRLAAPDGLTLPAFCPLCPGKQGLLPLAPDSTAAFGVGSIVPGAFPGGLTADEPTAPVVPGSDRSRKGKASVPAAPVSTPGAAFDPDDGAGWDVAPPTIPTERIAANATRYKFLCSMTVSEFTVSEFRCVPDPGLLPENRMVSASPCELQESLTLIRQLSCQDFSRFLQLCLVKCAGCNHLGRKPVATRR
jgi:hypothetical protein